MQVQYYRLFYEWFKMFKNAKNKQSSNISGFKFLRFFYIQPTFIFSHHFDYPKISFNIFHSQVQSRHFKNYNNIKNKKLAKQDFYRNNRPHSFQKYVINQTVSFCNDLSTIFVLLLHSSDFDFPDDVSLSPSKSDKPYNRERSSHGLSIKKMLSKIFSINCSESCFVFKLEYKNSNCIEITPKTIK